MKRKVSGAWYTGDDLPSLNEEDRAALTPLFQADIRATEALLDRSLSHWC